MADPGAFKLSDLVIHELPRGGSSDAPTLTSSRVRLEAGLNDYFQDKIRTSLAKRGVAAQADQTRDVTVARAARKAVGQPRQLLQTSRTIASHLHGIQTGRNPPGLLAVALGTCGTQDVLAVLKLEREEGVRYTVTLARGRAKVDLELLRNLTLTKKTKVFKTALVWKNGCQLVGVVSDDQSGRAYGNSVAGFFLADFLGFQLRDDPEQATKAFVQAVEAFINEDVDSPHGKADYLVALIAELHAQDPVLSATDFLAHNIHEEDQPALDARLRTAGVPLDAPFHKSAEIARRSFRMRFAASGMLLTGTEEALRDHVVMPDVAGGDVRIRDTVQTLQGR